MFWLVHEQCIVQSSQGKQFVGPNSIQDFLFNVIYGCFVCLVFFWDFLKTCSKFKWNQTVVSVDILQNKVILFSCSTLFCSYFHRLLELRDLKFQMMSNWWALLSSVLIKLFVPPGTVTCLKMWKLKRQKKK